MESVRFVGMDVHKDSIQMAVLSDQRHGAEIEFGRQVGSDPAAVKKVLRRVFREHRVVAGYEAGCMGYHLQRSLQDSGVECVVIAPSSIARAREIGRRPTAVHWPLRESLRFVQGEPALACVRGVSTSSTTSGSRARRPPWPALAGSLACASCRYTDSWGCGIRCGPAGAAQQQVHRTATLDGRATHLGDQDGRLRQQPRRSLMVRSGRLADPGGLRGCVPILQPAIEAVDRVARQVDWIAAGEGRRLGCGGPPRGGWAGLGGGDAPG